MTKVSLLVPVMLLFLMVQNGESLRCWTCSSDLNPVCNDPFLVKNNTKYLKLVNCDLNMIIYPYLPSLKSVCKKQKIYVNGQLVTLRGCTWKKLDDNTTTCPILYDTPNTRTVLCKTCNYDGCNVAAKAGIAPESI